MMEKSKRYRVGILATHPIQYYVPWYKRIAGRPEIDLKVFYCHCQTPKGQAAGGFGLEFDWDIPLLEGYDHEFLNNRARRPDVNSFFGCDTPDIKEFIHDGSFDAFILHGWHVKSFWQAIHACRKKRVPVFIRGDSYITNDRFWIKRLLKHGLYRTFIPAFDAYLTVGKRAEEYYLCYGADGRKMFFTPHAVDNDFFASNRALLMPARKELRKKWEIPEDSVVFLFAGKLISKKRPFDFLKALGLARKGCPKVFGLIAGDGALRGSLENMASRHNLPVAFTGFLNQKEMPEAYTVSDCLVLPSDRGETWGLVVNEAFACGLPAIVSDRVGCASDLVGPGRTGEVFHCGDTEALSKIMINLASEPEKLEYMGRLAKELINNYSPDAAVSGLVKALVSISG